MGKVGEAIKRHYPVLVLALAVFLFVSFASQCSFLYRSNEWNDPHCYYTVAMMMNNGKLLYREIIEQKGLYLYWIHMVAIYIAPGKYYGMYLFELLYGWVFAFAMYRIIRLIIDNRLISVLGTCLVLLTYYTSLSFCQGDSVEEMIVPLYALCLYWLIRMAKGIKDITFYELLLSGAFCGLALFSKFSLMSFFGGFGGTVFVLFLLENKKPKAFMAGVYFFLGMAIASIPALIYFGANNTWADLAKVYFYNNIFHYSSAQLISASDRLYAHFTAWAARILYGHTFFILILFGFIYSLFSKRIKKDRVYFSILATYIVFNVSVVIGGINYAYYGLPDAIYGFVGVVALYDLLSHKEKAASYIKKHNKAFTGIAMTALLILSFVGVTHMPKMFQKEENLIAYQMKAEIEQKKDATVLMYGHLDVGVYYLCNIMPTTKCFTGLNGNFIEVKTEQQRIVDEGKVTFVIFRELYEPKGIETHYKRVGTYLQKDIYGTIEYYLYEWAI